MSNPDDELLQVLIVDDDLPSLKLFSILLAGEGCAVRTARSAEEAVAVLETFRPRMIVLDMVLPLMSGLLFAQRLKADADTRDIAIVAVTTFNGPHAERMVLDAGCAACIRKPVDPLTFATTVRAHAGGE